MQRALKSWKSSNMMLMLALIHLAVAWQEAEAATTFVLVRRVVSPTSTGGGFFGEAAAVAGDKFLVGARGECATQCGGAIHLFDGSGIPVRTMPTPTLFSSMGASVGSVGNNPLAGAIHDSTAGEFAGAAYLFDAATGNLLRTFLNPNPARDVFGGLDFFGEAVASIGGNVLVSSPGEDIGADDSGVVYLFDGATGQLIRTIENPTPALFDRFGIRVVAVGNNIAISSAFDDAGAINGGAVHLFDANGQFITTIVSPQPVRFSGFGISLAAFGNSLLVGEERGLTGSVQAGAVHLFDGTTGAFIRSFFNPTPEAFELFGNSVAASGNDVLVGAIRDNTAGSFAGAAYLFDGTTGALIHTFLNPEPTRFGFGEDLFAWEVEVIGDSVLITAPNEDSDPLDQKAIDGMAYLFQRAELRQVQIDIKPGSDANPINPTSRGRTPVAVLSSADFDAPARVDRTSLTFGRTGAEASLTGCNPGGEDVNRDGRLDLVCHFDTARAGFRPGDPQGILRGRLTDGTLIEGRDSVTIVR